MTGNAGQQQDVQQSFLEKEIPQQVRIEFQIQTELYLQQKIFLKQA